MRKNKIKEKRKKPKMIKALGYIHTSPWPYCPKVEEYSRYVCDKDD